MHAFRSHTKKINTIRVQQKKVITFKLKSELRVYNIYYKKIWVLINSV